MSRTANTDLLHGRTILQVVHAFPPQSVTGTEQHVHGLARELAKRNRVHVFCRVIAPGADEYAAGDDRLGEVAVRRIATRSDFGAIEERAKLADPALEEAFAQLLEQVRPDLVHVHHIVHLSPSLIGMAKARGLPVVVTLHDYYFACPRVNLIRWDHSICDGPGDGRRCGPCLGAPHPVPGGQGWLMTLARQARMRQRARRELAGARAALRRQARALIERGEAVVREAPDDVFAQRRAWAAHQLGQADALIAPSRAAAEVMARQCPGLGEIQVVGHGIDVERFAGVQRAAGDVVRFGFLGTVIEHKGVEVLLRAFGRLAPGAASLVIHGAVGDALYAQRMERLAAQVGAKMAGPYRPEDLPGLLADIEVVVVPSVVLESFGLVVREAFAAGAPVIASRIGALAEAVRDGTDGLLVAPGDEGALAAAMQRLVEDRGLIETMRRNIPRQKTVAEHAAEMAAIYRDLLARGGP